MDAAAVPAPTATAAPTATPSALPTPAMSASTQTQRTDWPTYAHDLARSSVQPGSTALTQSTVAGLQLLWVYQSASPYDLASPIESNGVVYAADQGGNVVALNEATGTVVWQRAFGAEMKMTPSLYDGHLVVATFVNAAKTPSRLYSLDPNTGSTQWETTLPGGMHGAPLAFNGELYVPLSLGDPGFCNPGGVYMFNEATGATGLSWLTGGSVAANGGAVWSPLTYDGTRILFGTGNTCVTSPNTSNAITALSPSAGFLWADQTANPMTDDDVGGGVLESGSLAYVTGKNGNIYAVAPSTGAIVWERNLGAPDGYGSYAMPSISEGTLITSAGYQHDPNVTWPAGTQFGFLDGLDPNSGAQRWQITSISPFYQPPSVVGNVAFATVDATVAALDPATGHELWSTPIVGYSRSQVIVADNEVIAADGTGRIYAYGLPSTANAAVRQRTAATFVRPSNSAGFVNHIPAFCRPKSRG